MNEDKQLRAVEIDGASAVFGESVRNVASVLEAAGLDAGGRISIRIDGGRATLVPHDAALDPSGEGPIRLRTFPIGNLRGLRVNGAWWDWGASAIEVGEMRAIARLDEDVHLRRVGSVSSLTDAEIVDLDGEFPPEFTTAKPSSGQLVPVVVNGRRLDLATKDISFEELVQVAFPGVEPADSASRALTVTYRHGPPDRPQGALLTAEKIRLRPGAIFNVTATSKA